MYLNIEKKLFITSTIQLKRIFLRMRFIKDYVKKNCVKFTS